MPLYRIEEIGQDPCPFGLGHFLYPCFALSGGIFQPCSGPSKESEEFVKNFCKSSKHRKCTLFSHHLQVSKPRTKEIEEILTTKTAALLDTKQTGVHYLTPSGDHTDKYFDCNQALKNPAYATHLSYWLAREFFQEKVDLVIGPTVGALMILQPVALCLWAETIYVAIENGQLKEDFEIKLGTQIAIIEDVISTGEKIKKVVDLAKKKGGNIVGIGCIVDRRERKDNLGGKVHALLRLKMKVYSEEECLSCKKNIPLVRPGILS